MHVLEASVVAKVKAMTMLTKLAHVPEKRIGTKTLRKAKRRRLEAKRIQS